MSSKILHGDCLSVLPTLPEKYFQTCVTSPPYFGLRDYGFAGQIGNEKTPEEYVEKIVAVFREVRRVLRDDGTIWVNLGDSHNGSGKGIGDKTISKQTTNKGSRNGERKATRIQGLKRKDLIGIPWMVAFALRADGWYLRSDVIWSKPNPMPESVTDRPTRSHEYFFLLSKSAKYFYNAAAIRTKPKHPGVMKYAWGRAIDGSISDVRKGSGEEIRKAKQAEFKSLPDGQANKARDKQRGHSRRHAGFNDRWDSMTKEEQMELGANKRTVWEIATQSFPGSHFATFPPALIIDPILAGSLKGDAVLDPFFGAGTTGLVAHKLDREFVGIEASEKYAKMATDRIKKEFGMFSPI